MFQSSSTPEELNSQEAKIPETVFSVENCPSVSLSVPGAEDNLEEIITTLPTLSVVQHTTIDQSELFLVNQEPELATLDNVCPLGIPDTAVEIV
jgi:hypothetical protein